MAKDCRDCKDYRDCLGKPWYHYGEIRFCPYQVLWIIEIAETMGFISWPPNPEGAGHTDPQIKIGYASEAYFVKPASILAEVNYRLKRCGKDGKILRLEAEKGTDITELEPESTDALMYIKGWRRKRMSYQRWLRDRRYLQKR